MANDFSTNANCIALWRFEAGALTVDSSPAVGGNGANTLSTSAAPTESSGAGGYKEGACAADFETASNQYYSIADASLGAGFPFKNGDTTKIITLCYWFKPESLAASCGMFVKHDTNKLSFMNYLASNGSVYIYVGHTSGTAQEAVIIFNAGSVVIGRWYHLGLVVNSSGLTVNGLADKGVYAKLVKRDAGDTADETTTEFNGTITNDINVENSEFRIGSWAGGGDQYDGILDEMVVFNTVLSEADIDTIRNGTYGAPVTTPLVPTGIADNINAD